MSSAHDRHILKKSTHGDGDAAYEKGARIECMRVLNDRAPRLGAGLRDLDWSGQTQVH